MAVRKVRVGEVLALSRTRVAPDPTALYRHLGVKSFGKGVIDYGPTVGSELSKLSYFKIPAGALLLSNIKAWEQAVAVTSDRHREFVASQRFLPYIPKIPGTVDVHYLFQYFMSDPGGRLLQQASPGSVDRNRTLGIAAFENIEIPLPPIEEQRQIAARLDSLRAATNHVDGANDAAIAAIDRMEADLVSLLLGDAAPMRELVQINPTPERVSPESDVIFAPMATLQVETGSLLGAEVRKRSEVGVGYKQFSRGDIVFARITPSMQNGKSAVFDDPGVRIGYGTTEFHVLRARSSDYVPALHALVRSTWFKSLAKQSFTGTAGQQRVPASFLANVMVPNIKDAKCRRAIEHLKDLEDDRWRIRALAARRRELASALPKAVRNEIFSKLV